jgi:hypothetical protein
MIKTYLGGLKKRVESIHVESQQPRHYYYFEPNEIALKLKTFK